MTSKSHPSRNDDEEDDDELDHTQEVLKHETPLDSKGMDEEGSRDTGQTDTTLVPTIHFDVRRVQDILAKDDTVTGRPTQQDGIGRVHGRHQELGLLEDIFEVVLLSTVLGNSSTPFQIDSSTSHSNQSTNDPHDQGQTNTTRQRQNSTRGSEDTSTDDTVEDQKGGTDDTNLATVVRSSLEDISFIWSKSVREGVLHMLERPRRPRRR